MKLSLRVEPGKARSGKGVWKVESREVYGRRDAADQNKKTGSLPCWVLAGFLSLSPPLSGCHVPVGSRFVLSLGGWQWVWGVECTIPVSPAEVGCGPRV